MSKKISNSKEVTLQILVSPDVSTFSGGGAQKKVLKNASEALADLGNLLQQSASKFLDTLEKAGPDEIKLGLDVAFEAEGNWVVIAGKAGATASVELTWKRK